MPEKAAYGTWKSPISADTLTQKSIGISDVLVDRAPGKEGTIYHTEDRPFEAGRTVPVLTQNLTDVIPSGWSARSGVHEYGGSCTAVYDGILYFTKSTSQRLYRSASPGETPILVSPDNSNFRYGGFVIHPKYPHLLVSILEDHTKPAPADVVNKLVCVNTNTSEVTTLVEGADFYTFPSISPDGDRLAFVQWHHPNMPWEASELHVVDIIASDTGISLNGGVKMVAGNGEEGVSQPLWATNDILVFLSDRVGGFLKPWKFDVRDGSLHPVLSTLLDSDFSEPDWRLGDYRIAVLSPKSLLVAPIVNSKCQLGIIDIELGSLLPIDSPYVNVSRLIRVSETEAAFVGVQDAVTATLVSMKLQVGGKVTFTVLKATSDHSSLFPAELIAPSTSIALPNPDAASPLHVLLALPRNPDYNPEGKGDGEKPPCVVLVHGGPTARVPPGLEWMTQFFTSRGWAFCNVNYSGSSGYGRAYRERLQGNWGIVDVEDCATAVRLLGERGLIDPKRVAIRGGSSGGYTVLQALVNYPDTWAAGTSLYGISDLAALAGETHKFESQYLFKLIGGTIDEVPQTYKDRSPIHHAQKITSPILVLQGKEDNVVPQNQAEMLVNKVKEKGGKVKYILFEGEGHGFRKSENVKRALEEELAWYEDVFSLGHRS